MTVEQFNKLYDLITGIMVMSSLSLIVLVLICAFIFGYIYNQKVDKDIEKRDTKERNFNNRISDLESKLSRLDYWITTIFNKDKNN